MDQLKQKLTNPPLLVHYDPQEETIIRCDASGYGLGAVLLQKSSDPTKDGVVAYTSRTLSPSEKNYATTHKECLAVVHAVKQWRYYLYGKHFQIITDHHALCWLMKTRDYNGQLTRWSLILQEYNFTIHYSSGKLHNDADCLSRNPLPQNKDAEDEIQIPTWPIRAITRHAQLLAEEIRVPTYDIAKEQRSDEQYREVIDALLNESVTRKQKRKFKQYMIKDDQLYRRSKQCASRYLLAIPRSMVDYILEQAHDIPMSGHFGVKRTLETIRSKFFWPTLDHDIRAYIKSCDKCQRKKADCRRKEGLMIPMPIPTQPFEIVGADLMGPLTQTTKGKTHIFVITDYLSKYVLAAPMRKTTSTKVADQLKSLLFYKHIVPKIVITDNGANLTSFELRRLFNLLKITHKTTSPYRPQTNGQTERYNRVLGTQLTIFASEEPQRWDRYLDALVFAYNTTTHASHLQTPFYLVNGREAIKPMDLAIGRPIEEVDTEEQENEQDVLEKARDFARRLIQASQLKAKGRYDTNRVNSNYKVEDLVLRRKPPNLMREKRKFAFPWAGPYKVVRRLNEVNLQIIAVENPMDEHICHVS